MIPFNLKKDQVKLIMNNELNDIMDFNYPVRIEDTVIDLLIKEAPNKFKIDTPLNFNRIIREIVKTMYTICKIYKRHRIITDDLQIAFVLISGKPIQDLIETLKKVT